MTIEEVIGRVMYLPTAIAGATEASAISLTQTVDVVNIAVVGLLGIVTFFLRRLINKLDNVFDRVAGVDNRLMRLEIKHDLSRDCHYRDRDMDVKKEVGDG